MKTLQSTPILEYSSTAFYGIVCPLGFLSTSESIEGCPQECPLSLGFSVCGTDGAIYSSICEIKRINCGKDVNATSSECLSSLGASCESYCQPVVDLVCGNDGQTYNNTCLLMSATCRKGVHLAHYGPCTILSQKETCPKSCDSVKSSKPICGSDGNVYANECEMQLVTCGSRTVAVGFHHCQTTRHCHDDCSALKSKPVCGSDGNIYVNECVMKQKNCGKHVYEIPMAFCHDDVNCPRQCWLPKSEAVCGSDGNIYANECEMRMITCARPKKVISVGNNSCIERQVRCDLLGCSANYDPVCGTDGRTYSNLCQLQVAKCKRGVSVAHLGVCHSPGMAEVCPDQCPPVSLADDGPVCGSDGNIYSSACELKRKTCGQKVVPVDRKNCKMTVNCNRKCANVSHPVCGSDGNLYKSECHMFIKNCGKHIFQVPLHFCLKRVFKGCFEICPRTFNPICGSDLKTYSNECFIRIETCRSKGQVQVAYHGKCGNPSSNSEIILDPLLQVN